MKPQTGWRSCWDRVGWPLFDRRTTSSRYLFLAVPGGLDRLFDAWAAAQAVGSLDDALFRSLSDDYGIAWLE